MLKKYKLRDLISVTRGASLPGEYYSETGEYIRLTMGNFNYNGNGFKENTSKTDIYYTGPIREEFILKKGDIITPLTEQAIGLLGTTAMIPQSGKYIQSQDVALITCKDEKLDHLFCYYLISSDIVKKQLSAAAQQTKIRHTSPDKIMDCTVWIPEMAVQQRIGKALYDIDKKIALNTRMSAELEAMAKQIYDYWFVQFDFPDENGKPYKSSGGKMVYNEKIKREIPEGWDVKLLEEILSLLRDGTHNPPKRVESGIPLLTGTMFGKFFIDHSLATYITEVDYNNIHKQYKPQSGDIILTKIGTIGNVNYLRNKDIPLAIHCNSALLRFPLSMGKSFPLFLCKSQLFSLRLKAMKGQSVQEFVSLDKIGSVRMEIPNNELISLFNQKVDKIFDEITNLSEEIESLSHLRDSLLPMLMNGQVTVE